MNVLIAEDLKVIRSMVIRVLEQHGVDTYDEACDGKEAFEMLANKHYQMVVTDWNMPHKTGLEVVAEARARGCVGPIIMQTTESQKGHIIEAIEAGVTDYILKPFTARYLEDKLLPYVIKAEMVLAEEIISKKREEIAAKKSAMA